MKKMTLLMIALLVGSIALVACTPAGGSEPTTDDGSSDAEGETKTLFVGPETAECEGVAPQTCLLVKENPDDDYTFFYDSIEGFDYEPGYEYELVVEVTPVENPPADGSSLSYSLVEEVSKTPVEMSSSLEGTLWEMTSFVDENGKLVTVDGETSSTITFTENGRAAGNNGCNNVGMTYSAETGTISIEPGPSTLMACPPNVEAQANGYDSAVANAASYTVEGNTLTLADADGNTLATFKAVEPTELTGTIWLVTSYNNGNQAVVSTIIDTEITLIFNEDGSLNGTAGCNNYFGSYSSDGETISIDEQIGMTEMACAEPEGVMEQEQQFLSALPTAEIVSIDGDRLQLRTADGALVVDALAQ